MSRPPGQTPIAALACVAALAASFTPRADAQSPTPATSWRAPVQRLLERRARAVLDGDAAAFEDTMRFAPSSFRRAKRAWLRRIRRLPLETYALGYAEHGFDDLREGLRRFPPADEVHVAHVIERIGFREHDERPAAEDLFLTVIRRGERWSVYADGGFEELGLFSARNLWDFADVSTMSRGGVMVMYHRDRAGARRVLDATLGAIDYVRGRWPLGWHRRAIVMIPRSTGQLSRILQTTFDLGPFVAFAASSVERARGAYRLTGTRIYVQPDTFFDTPPAFQRDTLSHEILHLATARHSGAFGPAWLDEGVAQVYGERAAQPVDALRRAVRAREFEGLPRDFLFNVGTPAEIRLSYQSSAAFIAYLRDRFGSRAGARLYRAVGAETPVSFGTGRYHLDRAARAVFGSTLESLERSWTRRLEREL